MPAFNPRFFGSVFRISFILTVLASLAAFLTGRTLWIPGMWAAFLWLSVNGFLMNKLFVWCLDGVPKHRNKIQAVCIVKFPVLYLAGLGLLFVPAVKIQGVFAGFTVFMIAAAGLAAKQRFAHKKEV